MWPQFPVFRACYSRFSDAWDSPCGNVRGGVHVPVHHPVLIHSPISLADLPEGTRIYLIDGEYQVSYGGMIWPPRAVDDITPPSSTMTFDAFWDEMVTLYANHIGNEDIMTRITYMPGANT